MAQVRGDPLQEFIPRSVRAETGDTWRPRYGSHTSHTRHLASAAIDARDFMRARKDCEIRAHLPEGTLVAVAGGNRPPCAPPVL